MQFINKCPFWAGLALLLAFPLSLPAGPSGKDYPISDIPIMLLIDAEAVVRQHTLRFEADKLGKGIRQEHIVVTILDRKAADIALLTFFYQEDYSEITSLEANVYDAEGKRTNRFRKSDFKDITPGRGSFSIEDVRAKVLDMRQGAYPYTIEYKVQRKYTDRVFFPTWYPQLGETKVAVQQASFTLNVSPELGVRYKRYALPASSFSQPEPDTYHWQVSNLPAFEYTPLSPRSGKDAELMPHVVSSPVRYTAGGFKGRLDSWESMGRFFAQMQQGRKQLPPSVSEAIRQRVSGINDPYEKIREVYTYMQENTRYVSVQLGIGGWQPFPAEYVAKNKYGDCKALSNFTQSLLAEVGIEAFYTLIRAGRRSPDIDPDFPSQQFNHAILTVPLNGDTLWLECTSQTEVAGYNGTFTDNRHALMITKDGGKLIRTAHYDASVNRLNRRATVTISEKGDATANVYTEYFCQQQGIRERLVTRPKDEQRKALYNLLPLDNLDLQDYTLERVRQRNPYVRERLNLSVPKYAAVSGQRLFLSLRFIADPIGEMPEPEKDETDPRSEAIDIHMGYTDSDTVVFELPEGLYVEYAPEAQKLEYSYGSYESDVKVEPNRIIYIRRLTIKDGVFPAEEFEAMRQFREAVKKADEQKLVLVNKT